MIFCPGFSEAIYIKYAGKNIKYSLKKFIAVIIQASW